MRDGLYVFCRINASHHVVAWQTYKWNHALPTVESSPYNITAQVMQTPNSQCTSNIVAKFTTWPNIRKKGKSVPE